MRTRRHAAGLTLATALVMGGCAEFKQDGGAQGQDPSAEAQAVLEEADLANPDLAEGAKDAQTRYGALVSVADRAAEAGKHETALTFYRRAAAERRGALKPLLGMARSLSALDRDAAAVRAAKEAVDAAPEQPRIAVRMGYLALRAGRPRPAARFFRTALDGGASGAGVHNGLGIAADMRGEYPAAHGHYRRALEKAGGQDAGRIYNNLAFSHILAGDPNAAVEVLRPLLDTGEATARQRQNLAMAHGLQNNTERARELLESELPERAVDANLAFYAAVRTGEAQVEARRPGNATGGGAPKGGDAAEPRTNATGGAQDTASSANGGPVEVHRGDPPAPTSDGNGAAGSPTSRTPPGSEDSTSDSADSGGTMLESATPSGGTE